MTHHHIEHTLVDSSNLESAGYHPESQTLAVTFKSGGTYHYHGITPKQYEAFRSAESKGGWVHAHLVKPKHPFTKRS